MSWKNRVIDFLRKADDEIDSTMYDLRQNLGLLSPKQIIPFRTYGTADRIYVRGRVLHQKKLSNISDKDSIGENLLNMYKRLQTDEVSNEEVSLLLPGETFTTQTNKEGYYVIEVNPQQNLVSPELYFTLKVALAKEENIVADAQIMIPPADAEFGIISDIDDTIIQSSATNFFEMGKTVLLRNAHTRLPFAGVTEFYKALQLGRNGKQNNPFFYVSSSPWNLYDLLIDFMDLHKIPGGPLLLRDFGLQSDTFIQHDYLSHKFKEIKNILDTYPGLQFVLIGDAGEKDPSIYLEVIKKFPGRILAVYIRDMLHNEKTARAKLIAEEMQTLGVHMLLTPDSVKAAEHAASTGLIFRESIPAIKDDKEQDKGEAPGKSEMNKETT